ncbi:MAG: ABC transporter ATP-binding protein [Opitutales bacterium]|nr:ABC transporter ATP-binding protein [Opitutales bacterium]
MEHFIELRDICKSYGQQAAVCNATLELKKGEVFSLLGPSGCGKTTLLRILGGFQYPDSGRVIVNGQDITDLPANKRPINTVFQNYALFPNMTVWDNIAFGLRVARMTRKEINVEVDRMLELIDMQDHARKKPGEISGGQKQRVAIARALVNKPQLLLLDEPLAALDLKLRQRMLIELDNIHDEVGITFLYVTHDQGEAMSLSDRIAVMNNGSIEQIGSPVEIYEAPGSSFVAAFIGDTNFINGQVKEKIDHDYIRIELEEFNSVLAWNDKQLNPGERVDLSIRPEKFRLFRNKPEATPYMNAVEGTVEDIIYLGAQTKYWIRVGEKLVSVQQQHGRFLLDETPITWGENVWVCWHANDGYMLQRFDEEDASMLPLPPEEDLEDDEEAQ